jgi:uncharacterized protein YcgI (DUF1989 family)
MNIERTYHVAARTGLGFQDNSPASTICNTPPCDPTRYRQLGVKGEHASCQDNLHKALGQFGIRLDFTPQPWNLFTNFFINPNGTFTIKPPETKPGDNIVLRCEMGAYIVVSACPSGPESDMRRKSNGYQSGSRPLRHVAPSATQLT